MRFFSTLKFKRVLLFSIFCFLAINCSEDDSGQLALPTVDISTENLNFGIVNINENSVSQAIEINTENLKASLNISASTNFQISKDNVNFSQQFTILKEDANNNTITVYVRFSPLSTYLGPVSGTLEIQTTDVDDVVVNLLGEAVDTNPAINLNANPINFGEVHVNQTSDAYTLQVTGANLTSGIDISISNQFMVSLDDTTYGNAVAISAADANSTTTVYVKFSPDNVGQKSGHLLITAEGVSDLSIPVSGNSVPTIYNYQTFDMQPTGSGGGLSQSAVSTFNLHNDLSNISQIKMYLEIDCSSSGCDDWDRFANVKVKDPSNGKWYEIGRYITPYWVGTELLDRGLEFDVTDFKSLLQGSVELRIYVENWTSKADLISVNFDYIEGTPDYPYYAVSEVLGFHGNSINGIPYGVSHGKDLDKQISIPANAESAHLRTTISGWGHATPADADGRPCAEWCYRTHDVLINGSPAFSHYMGPIGCASNPINNQSPGNWVPDRAGWCPGMVVPARIDNLPSGLSGNSFNFEYQLENWTNNGQNGNAFYATSTYVVVKSNSTISAPIVVD